MPVPVESAGDAVTFSNSVLDNPVYPFVAIAIPTFNRAELLKGCVLMDFLTDRITVTMCNVVMRTDLLQSRGGLLVDLPHIADVAAWAPLLLLGKSGFVNEACATFTYHNSSETARLGVDRILVDGRKAGDLIARTAAIHIADPHLRKRIQIQARRCFGRRGLIALSDFRASGGAITELLNVIWRFRRDLYGVNSRDILRFIATVGRPQPIAVHLREVRRSTPECLACR